MAGCSTTGSPSTGPDSTAAGLDDYVPGPIAMRRLTKNQYVSTMHSLFGADLQFFPPTEVDTRVEGLLSLGANAATITPAGLERYESSARQVASQVLSPDRRGRLLGCMPESPTDADDACATEFVVGVGPRVLRRALREGEADDYVALAREATQELGDFYRGLESVLASWLLSADFLFIQERAHPLNSTSESAGRKLTAETLASRLSYFLWNSAPDAELLEAAFAGELDTDQGYRAQLERLLSNDERLGQGIRALFNDLYELDALETAPKDTSAFPQYTMGVIEDAKEQTLRTVVDHLLTRRADYRDLFTTRQTFMTKNLGPIYGIPVSEDWEAYEFPQEGARAGILSHVSFLALHARSARSSAVLRGEFILDSLLCTPIPAPPANVNFEALEPNSGLGDTARERLAVHRSDPNCAVCHDLMDPIGLAFENFDAIGQFRTQESGVTIETYGQIDETEYDDITGFYPALRNAPRLTTCMVLKLYMYAVGRLPAISENEVLEALEADFDSGGYDFVRLMENIALTHGFRATSGPREAEAEEGGA
ncbi:MAG: DUF1588 domain-containing protein [Myxococcales bacterium]|nr:DUF1588 domain-containing protein [Myxococcales bacterium]